MHVALWSRPLTVSVKYPGTYISPFNLSDGSTPYTQTTIAAFVGRTPFGPLDAPLTVFAFAEFTRAYGDLSMNFPLTYAVRDFFQNGGSQAIIVRLHEATSEGDGIARLEFQRSGDPAASAPLQLVAASPGSWGNRLRAAVDRNGITDSTSSQFKAGGLTRADLFNLTLEHLDECDRPLASERYLNVTVRREDVANAVRDHRLEQLLATSALCRVGALSITPPANAFVASGSLGSDGGFLKEATYLGEAKQRTGLCMLEQVELFHLLCIPPDQGLSTGVAEDQRDLPTSVHLAAAQLCTDRRAIYIMDPPTKWEELTKQERIAEIDPGDLGIHGQTESGLEIARNAAVYFPRYLSTDPVLDNELRAFSPCGMVAGAIAASDSARGVWKAPAGLEAVLTGVSRTAVAVTDEQSATLNSLGINCIRTFPKVGPVIWGARTLRGADAYEDDYKYLAVRRLVLTIEENLSHMTRWAVFEPNDEALWSSLRLCVDQFLAGLARQGAFYNYSITCDRTTTTLSDIEMGIVNILVGVAPVKPAEFIILSIQQVAAVPT